MPGETPQRRYRFRILVVLTVFVLLGWILLVRRPFGRDEIPFPGESPYRVGPTWLDPSVWRWDGEGKLDPLRQTRFVGRFILRETERADLEVDRIGLEVHLPVEWEDPRAGFLSVGDTDDLFVEIMMGDPGDKVVSFRLSDFGPIRSGFRRWEGGRVVGPSFPSDSRGDVTPLRIRTVRPLIGWDRLEVPMAVHRIELVRLERGIEARLNGNPFEILEGIDAIRGPVSIGGGSHPYGIREISVTGRIGDRQVEIVDRPRWSLLFPGPPVAGIFPRSVPFVAWGGVLFVGVVAGWFTWGGGTARRVACGIGFAVASVPLGILVRPTVALPWANGLLAIGLTALGWILVVYLFGGSWRGREERAALGFVVLASFLEGMFWIVPGSFWLPPAPVVEIDSDFREVMAEWGKGSFRGVPCPVVRSPHTLRVLCLGGSSTYGFPLLDGEVAFPARLRRLLASKRPAGIDGVETINAGVHGFTSTLAVETFERRLLDYRPDGVVFYGWYNDTTRWPRWFGRFPAATDAEAIRRLDTRSRLIRGIDGMHRVMGGSRLFHLLGSSFAGTRMAIGDASPYETSSMPPRASPEELGANLRRLAALGRERDFRVVVVPEVPAYGGTFEEERSRNPWIDAMARVAAEDDSILFVDVLTSAHARREDPLFYDPIHPTPEGHALLAECIADALLESGVWTWVR